MRYLLASAFCLLLLSPQAHACRSQSMEDTLFFEAIPDPQPEADLIAQVALSDVNDGTATAKLIKITKTSNARLHPGDTLPVKYNYTSCGPNEVTGSQGMIIAKVGTDSNGHLVLYPYLRKYGNGLITPPNITSNNK